MLARWYICPYDIVPAPHDEKGRACAMMRYLPVLHPRDLPQWDEAEIRGNHALVKVVADESVHAEIQADADFVLLEFPARGRLAQKLQDIGYARETLDEASNFDDLADRITSVKSTVRMNDTQDGVIVGAARGPTKRASDIRRRLS